MRYLPETAQGQLKVQKTREEVWVELGHQLKDMDKAEVFYPDTAGYFVSSITCGKYLINL